MSFDWLINWTRTSDKETAIPITDCISASITKSTDIQNNICELTLKNSSTVVSDDGSTILGTYVNTTDHTIKFVEDDEIRVWADYLSDASEVGTAWHDDARLLGAFAVEEHDIRTMEDQSRIVLHAVDVAYKLFNAVFSYSYGISNNFTAPGIVRNAVRWFTEKNEYDVTYFLGTDNDDGTYYTADAQFLSEGGAIQDYRAATTTQLDGGITDADATITVDDTTDFETIGTLVIGTEHISYTGKNATQFTGCTRGIDDTEAEAHLDNADVYQGFPLVYFSKSWEPIFEWISEISQTENTNYSSEYAEGGTLFYSRAFLFWLDEGNKVHWVYPDDTVDQTITLGEEDKRSFSLTKSVFDAVNFVVYNCGEDLYGNGCIYYKYDDNTNTNSLKMRYQPMTSIINDLMYDDITYDTTAGRTRETTNQDVYKNFVQDADYPLATTKLPTFIDYSNAFRDLNGDSATTSIANDSEYNDALREAAKWKGYQEAGKIITARTGLRWAGSIALKGTHMSPGDLVEVTNPFVGLNSQLLRVTKVTHAIGQNTWETTIDVEEDEAEE